MEWLSSADLKEWSGASTRQFTYWCDSGFIGGRFVARGTGRFMEAGGSGYNRVFDALDLSVARVLVEVGAVLGQGSTRYAEIAKALRTLPLAHWPAQTLVVTASGVRVNGPLGSAALVVDLGACAYPQSGGNGLAAVV